MLKRLITILITIVCSLSTIAQEKKTITGVVNEASSGEPLIGAAVVEESGKNGCVTDIDGRFTLQTDKDVVTVSYVGFESQTVSVPQSTNLVVNLKSDMTLDEVVVVGYTAMKKRDVLGSISKVNSKDLTKVPVSSASEALQGRVSGVQVTSATGAPGAGVSVRVRGVGSVNSSNEPLYIVDGIAADNGLNSINPSDIENISVLKDASTAAVYGSRAANGVVLVTTKSGVAGKPQISYNGQSGIQTHGHLPKLVNTSDYINIYNAAATTDGRDLIQGDYMRSFSNTNHLEEIFRTAWMNSHELSVRGGKDKISYLSSFNYFNQEGIIYNSGYEKFSGRVNLNYKPISWLKVGIDMNGAKEKTDVVPSSGDGYGNDEGGSVVRYAMMRSSAVPTYNSEGGYVDQPGAYFGSSEYNTFFGDAYNPFGLTQMSDRVKDKDSFLGKVFVEVNLPYNTFWKTNLGLDYTNYEYKIHNKTWGTNDRINNTSSLQLTKNESFGWTVNSVLNSIHTFNDIHNLTVMLGTEGIRYHGHDSSLTSSVKEDSYTRSQYAYSLLSFFAKADYNFNHKYYLSALIREDGSSRFTKGNRWGTFYSFSAGWDVSEEAFMKPLTFINLLKLRAGWGAVGNQDVGLYAYTDKYNPYSNYPFGGVSSTGYVQTALGNEDLKWETSKQLNLGIDMSFLNGQYGFSVDYYNKVSDNMLIMATLPPSVGSAQAYYINAGSMRNRGLDVEVYARKQFTDFGFSATVNWSLLSNKVLKWESPTSVARVDNGIYAKLIEEGYSVGSFYMYEMIGIFQNEEEVVKSAYQGANVQAGDVKYANHSGTGTLNADDRIHIGSSLPTQTLGVNLAGNYKNWDITAFFQGAFGNKIYNQIATETEGFYRGFNVSQEYYDNYWRGEGTTNKYPRASWSAKDNNVMTSSRFLEDGSYLRLKNVQLGYTFPLKSKFISNLRVYGSITNLLTFTNYSGLDPEMTTSANASSEGDKANGIDWGTYPVAKTFTMGVNITF